ncbi:LOW QUALITY PROTEIN: proteasome subunit beta type-7-like [Gopherus flavomarginatus]|uniref:LOW QUALITY PROTEIN: proteasome subunit beta type-7-like n=1 Tax=Gopherus flavomarginatus TaxID=286002 RepID=UPI0021CBFC01|nr:LOW QUALITY PROTEIN: proteasome subunit beta type-7-like [Gopherus flavomarginatus]
MDRDKLPPEPRGGFAFENCLRNAALAKVGGPQGFLPPKARKTGTTIAGLIYKEGVILGADTRATDDMVVADKNCEKIHFIAPNIYCCGAGVAADAEVMTQLLSSNMELHSLSTGRLPRVATACRFLKQMLFRYQGHIGASLILGGVDSTGPHLYSVHPHGSTSKLPFTSMGSGAAAAIAVLEDRFKPDMELAEAQELLADAITAGVLSDLGSGSNVDLCVITGGGAQTLRPFRTPIPHGQRQGRYRYRAGTTAVLSEAVAPLRLQLLDEMVTGMDVD